MNYINRLICWLFQHHMRIVEVNRDCYIYRCTRCGEWDRLDR